MRLTVYCENNTVYVNAVEGWRTGFFVPNRPETSLVTFSDGTVLRLNGRPMRVELAKCRADSVEISDGVAVLEGDFDWVIYHDELVHIPVSKDWSDVSAALVRDGYSETLARS